VWATRHQLECQADPLAAWELISDAARWPEWNHEIAWSRYEGPLQLGAVARIKFRRPGPALRFRVVELEPARLMTDETRLPGARMGHRHRVADLGGGRVLLENQIYIAGPLSALWAAAIGRKARRELPGMVERIAALAGGR
jgi:hypothetical protein